MPTVNIRIYAPLSVRLGLVKGSGRAILEQAIDPGEGVRGVFRRLAEQLPAFYGTVLEPETGRVVPQVILLVNGRWLTAPAEYDAPLPDGAEIVLLPAYAGG